MEKLCNNCKYWVSVDSMPNWGNCHRAGRHHTRSVGERSSGDVLRRYDESCRDFDTNTLAEKKRSKVSQTREA